MSILFVTAFKDIHRKNWHIIPRTNDEYIEQFMNLARTIKYRLIVFVEPFLKEILSTKNLPSTIELVDSSLVTTFYDRFIENERAMITSDTFTTKVPADRKGAPEHWCAEYTMVNHSKINYVAYCKRAYPAYEFYSWLDFGCIRNTVEDVPVNINFSKLHKKISYLSLKEPPSLPISANDMIRSHDVYLAGSQFVVHTDLVDQLEQLYEAKLLQWQKDIICDEDQGLILQLYFENRDLFELFPSNKWFTLFSRHLNIPIKLSSKNDIHTIINAYNLTGSYVEIGVARGIFTEYILKNTQLSKLYLIDPYKNFRLEEYTDGMNKYNMEEEYNFVKQQLTPFNNRIEFIRKTSTEAITMFADESLDVVYIDGNHEYTYVMEDLINYWKKLKVGGILIGDDVYELGENNSKNVTKIWDRKRDIYESESFGVYGVHNALLDFCKQLNIQYTIFSNQFIIFKH